MTGVVSEGASHPLVLVVARSNYIWVGGKGIRVNRVTTAVEGFIIFMSEQCFLHPILSMKFFQNFMTTFE